MPEISTPWNELGMELKKSSFEDFGQSLLDFLECPI
jgi:hypothetical protein